MNVRKMSRHQISPRLPLELLVAVATCAAYDTQCNFALICSGLLRVFRPRLEAQHEFLCQNYSETKISPGGCLDLVSKIIDGELPARYIQRLLCPQLVIKGQRQIEPGPSLKDIKMLRKALQSLRIHEWNGVLLLEQLLATDNTPMSECSVDDFAFCILLRHLSHVKHISFPWNAYLADGMIKTMLTAGEVVLPSLESMWIGAANIDSVGVSLESLACYCAIPTLRTMVVTAVRSSTFQIDCAINSRVRELWFKGSSIPAAAIREFAKIMRGPCAMRMFWDEGAPEEELWDHCTVDAEGNISVEMRYGLDVHRELPGLQFYTGPPQHFDGDSDFSDEGDNFSDGWNEFYPDRRKRFFG